MAQSQHFSPADFTPSKFSTAEQKAIFGNQLLAFVAAGFPEKKFTNALYERLSNCFGFIAHMNRNGFFETFFTCIADKLRFIQALANAPRYGDPAYTFSDVERAIGEVVRSMGWEAEYETRLAQESETIERNLLTSLASELPIIRRYVPKSAVIRTNAKIFEML
ncbi:MAG TPA: hypothetical protein VK638_03845 [Edaphobacter sp.]|jgi:hypothetical protein|nr:hypothetical protein [Edaphobacter sp.]